MEAIGTKNHGYARVGVLLGLVFAAAVTMRGRLPDARYGPRERGEDSPATLAGLVTMLSVAVVVMGIALVIAARKPKRGVAAGRRDMTLGAGDGTGRLGRRLQTIALGLALAWLAAFVLVQQIGFGPTLMEPPPPISPESGGAVPGPPAPSRTGGKSAFWYLMGAAVLTTAMIVVSGVVSAIRRPKPEPAALIAEALPAPAPAPEPLAVAAERGLAEVGDLSRGPRAAIIACYAAMEQALADAPGAAPQASDTPSEVLARAVGSGTLTSGSAAPLVEVFTEARFSRHEMTEEHREIAERALRSVLDDVRSRA